MQMNHNTIVSYANTTFDMKCLDATTCADATLSMSDNIVLGYSRAGDDYNSWYKPAVFCGANCNETTKPIGTIQRTNNIYYGFRSCPANNSTGNGAALSDSATGEFCTNPGLIGEPAAYVDETTLDGFAMSLSFTSAARNAGISVGSSLLDSLGLGWATPPSIGALEYSTSASPVLLPLQ